MDHKETRAVRAQLAEIINSSDFTASDRLKDFLTYVVERTLEGRENTLKAYTIAVEVFGMREDFDPRLNPLVRMEASRLRSKLDHYYLRNPGAPVYINMPKGGYSAVFSTNTAAQSSRARKLSARTPFTHEDNYVSSILLAPLINIDGSKTTEMFIQGLALEINHALTKFKQLKIIDQTSRLAALPPDGEAEASLKKRPRFVLKGSAQIESDQCLAWISLIDSSTNYNLWAEKFSGDLTETHVFKLQTRIAEAVSFNISDDFGLINRTLLRETAHKNLDDIGVYEATLRYHAWIGTFDRNDYLNAKQALEHSYTHAPDNAMVCALLSDIYSADYEFGYDLLSDSLDRGLSLAINSLKIDSACQMGHWAMALNYCLRGDIPRMNSSIGKIYPSDNTNPYLFVSIGLLTGITKDLLEGKNLVEEALRLNPYSPSWCHLVPFIYYYAKKNYEAALDEALQMNVPTCIWDPIARAAVYGKLGAKQDGQKALEQLLALEPDFPQKRERLLYCMLSDGKWVRLITEGLIKAGLP